MRENAFWIALLDESSAITGKITFVAAAIAICVYIEKLGLASKKTTSYFVSVKDIKSFIQFIIAAQGFVPGIWLLANVEMAFDCNSSIASPQSKSMFSSIYGLCCLGFVK